MKKINSDKIFRFIMPTFSYIILCSNNILKSYDINSWIIYILFLLVFFKSNINEANNKKESIIISCILSFIIVYGKIVYTNMYSKDISIINKIFSCNFIFNFFCYFNLLFVLLINIFPKVLQLNIANNNKVSVKKKTFFICIILMLLAWLFYFLSFYPGTMSPDSIKEYGSIYDGIKIVSDHHPILHALFIGTFYKLGMVIFHNSITAIALVTIVQMIVLSIIFSYLIYFLKQKNVKNSILVIMFLLFSFLPMNGYYSITMWKDILFAGFIILLTIELIKISDKCNLKQLGIGDFIRYIFVSLLTIFFRNNAFYMWLFTSFLFFLILERKNRKALLISSLVILSVYFFVKIPVFKIFKIQKSETVEYVGIPLQQIGRMAYKDVDFTNEELDLINNIMPLPIMKDAYNPTAVDYIKFNKSYNKTAIDEQKFNYLKLYLKLIYKHPSIVIEQYSISTLGYWYPGVNHWSTINNITENPYGLKTHSIIKNNEKSIIQQIEKRTFPILSIEWSIGLYFWLLYIFMYISIKKKGIRSILIYSPCIGIWLTMMIASPIYAEFRYIYCVAVTIPLLILYPYLDSIKEL